VMAQSRIFICEFLADFEMQARRNLTKALVQDWLMLGYWNGQSDQPNDL